MFYVIRENFEHAKWGVYSTKTPPIVEVLGGGYVFCDIIDELIARVDSKEMAIKLATLLVQDDLQKGVDKETQAEEIKCACCLMGEK